MRRRSDCKAAECRLVAVKQGLPHDKGSQVPGATNTEYAQNPCDNKARNNENVHMAEKAEINCDMFTSKHYGTIALSALLALQANEAESQSTELQGTRVNQRGKYIMIPLT